MAPPPFSIRYGQKYPPWDPPGIGCAHPGDLHFASLQWGSAALPGSTGGGAMAASMGCYTPSLLRSLPAPEVGN